MTLSYKFRGCVFGCFPPHHHAAADVSAVAAAGAVQVPPPAPQQPCNGAGLQDQKHATPMVSAKGQCEDEEGGPIFHLLSGKPDPPNKNKWGPSKFVLLSGQSSEEEEEEDDEYDLDEEEEEELVQTP